MGIKYVTSGAAVLCLSRKGEVDTSITHRPPAAVPPAAHPLQRHVSNTPTQLSLYFNGFVQMVAKRIIPACTPGGMPNVCIPWTLRAIRV